MDQLSGIEAKLRRGFEHVESVEREVRTFLDAKPWHLSYERDKKPGWTLVRFMIEREPPIEWSVVVGEAIGQFHSSLDHLMTELAVLRRPSYRRRPGSSPNFPICSVPGEFWRPGQSGRNPADHVRREVRPEHFAELERLQPRKPEDMHPTQGHGMTAPLALYVVRTANNMHKHATVRPAFVSPTMVRYRDVNANITGFEEIYTPLEPLNNGAELYRARFVGEPDVGVQPMDVTPDVDFSMGQPRIWLPIGTVRLTGEFVGEIISRFREVTAEFNRRRPDIELPFG